MESVVNITDVYAAGPAPVGGCKTIQDGSCPSGYPLLCTNNTLCCQTLEGCGANNAGAPLNEAFQNNSSTFSPFCEGDSSKINTAFGCVSVSGTGFVTTLLNFGIGIAGGIAFLLIIFGGFQILTSAGNPERLNEGKELISSAITGLMMIVFSVLLLRIIGVDILGIPSFS